MAYTYSDSLAGLQSKAEKTMPHVTIIEIAGWLSDRQIAKGQTAVWTGSEIDETCEIHDGYYFDDDEIERETAAAQEYANKMIKEKGWAITAHAYPVEFEQE